MDIICGKCGKHFSSIEGAREHNGHCRETSKGEPIHWVAAQNSKVTPEEWENLMNLINARDVSQTVTPFNLELTAMESTGPEDSNEPKISIPPSKSENTQRIPNKKESIKNKREKTSNFGIPTWLIALLFVFALSIIGLGFSLFVGLFIPLWILFGFSLIYTVEKWFYYLTRKYKYIGKLYRLFLNLAILCLLSLIIWSGIKLFSLQYFNSPLVGSLVFLLELVFFIWMWRTVSKNSWRWPNMKLTVFSLMCLFLIFSFAGVQPMAGYKDATIEKITNIINEQKIKAEERAAQERIVEEERLSTLGITNPSEFIEEFNENKELRIGIEVVELVNTIRQERGSPILLWDEKLYEYSMAHSEAMASRRDLFHSSMDKPYAENAWGGEGSKSWGAETIVESWMNSDMHRTWLLCPNLKHVAVGVTYSNNGMYASWTFWRSEPALSDWWYQYSPGNPPEWWY